jgi:hypothetical protein
VFGFVALVGALAGPAAPQPAAPVAVPYTSSVKPLPPSARTLLRSQGIWRPGCPVALSDLRLLTVTHRGFDHRSRTGQLIVNAAAAEPLARVFKKVYDLHFPIRRLSLEDAYDLRSPPPDGDTSGSFSCRQAVPSPCTGGTGTGTWSMHAYGLAVDVNPRENPYVGCGMSHDRAAIRYSKRSRHRPGMLTARVIQAFASAGWGWGGAWVGDTHDYMHFSSTGH